MQPEKHIRRLLDHSDRLPAGAVERAFIDEAVCLADTLADEPLAYEGRLRQSSSAALTGDTAGRLDAFEWCLQRHLSDPLTFSAAAGELSLLWEFRTIPLALASSPRFSRATISQSLEELHDVYTSASCPESGSLFAHLLVATAMGESAQASAVRARLTRAEHSEARNSAVEGSPACSICLESEMAERRADYGDVIAAASDYDAFFDAGLSCAEEPERALAHCLLPYLQTGQSERAAAMFARLYPLIRSNPRYLPLIAQCLRFTRITGDLEQGLKLLRRHLSWLAYDPLDARSRFHALTAMAGLLDALSDAGQGDLIVGGADNPDLVACFGAHVGQWIASDLAAACWQTAEKIGEAFDARNGNAHYANQLASSRERPNVPDDQQVTARALPSFGSGSVTSIGGRGTTTAVAAQTAGAAATAPAAAGHRDTGTATSAHTEANYDGPSATEWLAIARERATISDDSGARWALRWAEDSLDRTHRQNSRQREALRASLWAVEIRLDVQRDDLERAERLLDRRIEVLGLDSTADHSDLIEVERRLRLVLFGAAPGDSQGDLERALDAARQLTMSAEAQLSILNALGELRIAQARPSDAAGLLLAAVRLCGHAPDDDRVRRPLYLLARARFDETDFDGAVMALDRLLRHQLDRAFRASALLLRASAHFGRGSLSTAVEDADRALSLYFELSHGPGIVESCSVLASLLEAQGIQTGVVEAWKLASDEADDLDLPDAAILRFRFARSLLTAERGAEAAVELDTVFAAAVFARATLAERAEILFWLGHAQRLADDDDAAYCSWSLGLSYIAETPDSRQGIRIGLALGRLLLDNDEEDSRDVLAETVRQARLLPDSPWELVDALHLYGIAQTTFGFTDGLRALDEAIDVAAGHSLDIDALVANVTESRARGLDNLGLDRDAVDIALESAKLYERLGDRISAGHAHLFTARLLATQGRVDEARPAYERSLELLVGQRAVTQMAEKELHVLVGLEAPKAGTTVEPSTTVDAGKTVTPVTTVTPGETGDEDVVDQQFAVTQYG